MSAQRSVEIVLDAFRAVERRDEVRLQQLYHPQVSFHWPPELPYGSGGRTWSATWDPLQPDESERRMDPRVVAADETEVVVLWHQRGRTRAGRCLDSPVLGLYEVREEKFYRAQMFYFDPAGVREFLEDADRSSA